MSAFMIGRTHGVAAIVLAVVAALLLSGCASQFSADVTRFHDLPAISGQTVQVVGKDPALEGGLEFASYADLVGTELESLGYRPPVAGQTPDLIAAISYSVESGRQPLRREGGGTSVGVGVGGGSRSGVGVGISTGFNLSGGERDGVYVRRFALELTRTTDSTRVFEGRAISEGKNRDLGSVMPYLVEALFTDFPGKSGETREVRLKASE